MISKKWGTIFLIADTILALSVGLVAGNLAAVGNHRLIRLILLGLSFVLVDLGLGFLWFSSWREQKSSLKEEKIFRACEIRNLIIIFLLNILMGFCFLLASGL